MRNPATPYEIKEVLYGYNKKEHRYNGLLDYMLRRNSWISPNSGVPIQRIVIPVS
jgi:hypothetical protein